MMTAAKKSVLFRSHALRFESIQLKESIFMSHTQSYYHVCGGEQQIALYSILNGSCEYNRRYSIINKYLWLKCDAWCTYFWWLHFIGSNCNVLSSFAGAVLGLFQEKRLLAHIHFDRDKYWCREPCTNQISCKNCPVHSRARSQYKHNTEME